MSDSVTNIVVTRAGTWDDGSEVVELVAFGRIVVSGPGKRTVDLWAAHSRRVSAESETALSIAAMLLLECVIAKAEGRPRPSTGKWHFKPSEEITPGPADRRTKISLTWERSAPH